MVDESRSLLKTLRKWQKNWIGHVLRQDCLLQKVIERRLQRKKTPGRPRAIWLDAMIKKMKRMRLTVQSWKKKHITEKLGVT